MLNTKCDVRKSVQLMRKDQPEEMILSKSLDICKRLIQLPQFIKSRSILVYLPKKEEVQTNMLVNEILKQEKNVLVPFIEGENLKISQLRDLEVELEDGPFGILQQKKEFVKEASMNGVDLVIVPGVAFDLAGRRIGFGKGYYDRLLANFSISKFALAFEFQVLDKLQSEEHDVNMNYIVTEERVINCEKRGIQ